MLRIGICDDDKEFRMEIEKALQSCLEEGLFKNNEVIHFESGEQCLLNCREMLPMDLLFLDIEMKTIDGIETARILKEVWPKCIIIFITSHSIFVKEAFRLGAFQYLQKPLDLSDFKLEVDRALKQHQKNHFKYGLTWNTENIAIIKCDYFI